MFTAPDSTTLSIAQAASIVIGEATAEVIARTPRLDEAEESDTNYKDVAKLADRMSDVADENDRPEFHSKAASLHVDAASMSGNSQGEHLYTTNELYHLSRSKYHSERASGMSQSDAIKTAEGFYTEMAAHKRHIFSTE